MRHGIRPARRQVDALGRLLPVLPRTTSAPGRLSFPACTGDLGNDGALEMDYACWGLGVETFPSKITGVGGKYYFDDDQEYPEKQHVIGDEEANRMLSREYRKEDHWAIPAS